VVFVPDPVAWTEAPESVRVLGRQRDRWHRGLADTLWRHRRLCFNPRYGALGIVVYTPFLLIELFAPLVEAFGLLALPVALWLGAVNVEFAILLLLLAYGYGTMLTIFSMVLEELAGDPFARFRDRLRMIPWIVAESIGYRQLTVVWRLHGLWRFVRGQTDWGTMTRSGFSEAASPEAGA
jgi:cellulose synthase/poly-beta-1,6-N-acetylglucosamine synthase-like glycosyltransferase